MSVPEIRVMDINPLVDDFFFIASDGLIDAYESKEAIKFFRKKLAKFEMLEQDTHQAIKQVVQCAKKKKGMRMDNITVILVALNRGVERLPKVESD